MLLVLLGLGIFAIGCEKQGTPPAGAEGENIQVDIQEGEAEMQDQAAAEGGAAEEAAETPAEEAAEKAAGEEGAEKATEDKGDEKAATEEKPAENK